MRVAFLILGLGTQGSRGLITFVRIQEYLKRVRIEEGQQIRADLAVMIDPSPKKRERREVVREIFECLKEKVETFENIEAWLKEHEPLADFYLVYDASPSGRRVENILQFIGQPKVAYLAEKPLAVDAQWFGKLREVLDARSAVEGRKMRLLCDFIETRSLPFILAKEYVSNSWSAVRSIRSWRESCVGLEMHRDPRAREGVTGGALEDKIVHDIATARQLFAAVHGNPPSMKSLSVRLRCLMPNVRNPVLEAKPPFLATDGGLTNKCEEAADAITRVTAAWNVGANSCALSFSGSWLGVSRTLCDQLSEMSLPAQFKSWHRQKFPVDAGPGEEEARICVVTGTTKAGVEETLVLNYLVPQWAVKSTDAKAGWEPLPGTCRFGSNSLARVFCDVIESIAPDGLTQKNANGVVGLEESAALDVHEHLFEMRTKLNEGIGSPEQEAKKVARVLGALHRGKFLSETNLDNSTNPPA